MRRVVPLLAACVVLGSACGPAPSRVPGPVDWTAPAGDEYARVDRQGRTVLPNGRIVTPRGRQIPTAPHPFGMALGQDGRTLVTVNGGTGPFSLTIIDGLSAENPVVRQVPAGAKNEKTVPSAFIGAAVDTTRGLVYASGGDDGRVGVFRLADGVALGGIDLNTPGAPDAFTTDLALSPDRRWLYALDLAHYRLVVVDTATQAIAGSIGVGRNPFAVVVGPDGRRVYVANMGTFEYSLVETRAGDDPRGLRFPPFGYPSHQAREGTVAEGRKVQGLGDPNVDEACSVFAIDVADPRRPSVAFRLRTGLPVGQAIGGSSPAGLAVSADTLFVANATNDTVEAYDLATKTRRWTTLLGPAAALATLRGVLPFGLALSPDRRRLYVAESGINALGVLDATSGRALGHIPTAWYPARVAVSPDGQRLFVSNAKGYGSGPNGGSGFTLGAEGHYIGALMKGTVSLMATPTDAELPALTDRLLANNGLVAAPSDRPASHPVPLVGRSQKIRHVVLIAKENRTFDEVFGDWPGANGEPSLARFGASRRVGPHDGVTVMPNHRALAERFAMSDNFYVDSDVSADGHRWLVGAYANHWVETITAAGYGKAARWKKTAPGRLALFESNSSLAPEDYLERGSLWEHLERGGVSFWNYGEGFELAGISEDAGLQPTGARLPVNIPMPEALFARTARNYPGFNTNIPDQRRADIFLKDLESRWVSGREPFPGFVFVQLPQDHGAKARPEDGYPYLESYMADNDLALGRVVEALSKSPFWKETAIFVTEDDAQSGLDHVDAHRSLCLVASPWARRGHISRRHVSIASIHKTIYRILGLGPLNLYDAATSDLGDLFATEADLGPFRARPVDPRIFDPAKVKDPGGDGEAPDLDSAEEARRQLPR
jgi:DNA-binding beta-propeller fold protein YncE